MDGSDGIGVYGEAKAEYTRQLCSFLVPALETYFLDVLADVKANEKDPKRILWVFQDALKQFPDWNIDKVQRETEKIQTATRCDYLEEILTAVFIAHTKVLSAIRITSKQKKLQITIPKIDHFLHRTMSECARLLWSSAYLFSEAGPAVERQKNLRQVGQLLHEGVLQSIRGMVPVKSILKEYLSDDTEDIGNEQAVNQEEESAPILHEESITAPSVPPPDDAVTHPIEEVGGAMIDLSGSEAIVSPPSLGSIVEPVLAPAPPPAPTPVPPPVPPPAPAPIIVVDTEPPSVGFTQIDAVLDSEHPDQSTIQASNQLHMDDDQQEITHIEFDDADDGEDLDDFENLEMETEVLAVGEDEFETL